MDVAGSSRLTGESQRKPPGALAVTKGEGGRVQRRLESVLAARTGCPTTHHYQRWRRRRLTARARGAGRRAAANLFHDLVGQKRLLEDLEIMFLASDLILARQLDAGHADHLDVRRYLAQLGA